ncbi:MAG: phosphoenolpyruvate synthase [Promethearchaeota archaeon]|nr:MAG: phosphoenolpyruvate synthase [Candidatus Lokiarchaeota archaeon]
MEDILWFEDIGEDDLNLVGGKGLNLGLMVKQDFPIPPGFVITAETYFEFIEETNIKSKIKKILNDLDIEETEKLQDASEKIKDFILGEDFTEELKSSFMDAFDKLKEDSEEIYLAVRSSATAEDLPDASFAGQQDTYLGVDKDNYLEAVKKCWASLFTARAIYYRENNDFDHMKVGIAVIVQKLIDAEVAGVVFTQHPSTGEDIVIIEAGFGLGEAVVSGSITPDTYEVDPDGWSIKNKEISTQSFKVVREGNETKEVELTKEEGKKQKLPDEEIEELAKICKDIEEYYEEGQDIEWAFSDDLYIVQSRPITTIKKKESSKEGEEISGEILFKGLAASPGVGGGTVKIIKDASELSKIEEGEVLVTTMTTPDMVPGMKRSAAIITDEGGMTSHAAIVSRELGVPCVVGSSVATETLSDGDKVTVDGAKGIIYEGVDSELIEKEKGKKKSAEKIKSEVVTGTNVYVNLSSPSAAEEVAKRNVDGVGLFRAEFIAAQIGFHPNRAIEQGRKGEWIDNLSKGLRKVASEFDPRPVIYRTLDFKTNEYRDLKGGKKYEPKENNPMIGFRGAFRNIHDREVFEMEIQAIKRVRNNYNLKNLHVMIPFVRTLQEIEKAVEIMRENGLERNRDFKLWIMVEVPSTVFLIDQFLEYVDGVSIGSNDLTQLTLGVDRDNENLSEIFDERDPAVLKALELTIEGCRKKNKTVSICGQAPSVYEEIVEFLVEHGITSVSVNPDAIESTRRLVASVEQRFLLNKMRNL